MFVSFVNNLLAVFDEIRLLFKDILYLSFEKYELLEVHEQQENEE